MGDQRGHVEAVAHGRQCVADLLDEPVRPDPGDLPGDQVTENGGDGGPWQVADLDDGAAAGGRAEHSAQRSGGTGGLEHQLGVRGQRVACGQVADLVGPQGLGHRQGGVGDVGRDDGGRAAVLGRGDHQRADRPRPVHDHVATPHVARPVHRVQGDGEGFGQRPVLGADPVGQRADLVGADHSQLAEPAVGVRVERRRAEVADPRVEVGAAGDPVGQAPVPHQLGRVDGDPLPDLVPGDAGADLGDPPGHLVAEDQGVAQHGRAGAAVAPVGQVGAADPAPLHRDQHLARAGDRVGPLVDPQVTGTVDDDRLSCRILQPDQVAPAGLRREVGGHQGDQRVDDEHDGDGPPAAGDRGKGRGEDRADRGGQDAADLLGQRELGEPGAGAEQLRHRHALQREQAQHPDVQADDHGQHEGRHAAAGDQQQHREGERHGQQGQRDVDRPPAEAVAEQADDRDGDEAEQGSPHDRLRRHGLGDEQRGGDVADQEGLHEAGVAGLTEPQPERQEERLALALLQPGLQDARVRLRGQRLDLLTRQRDTVDDVGTLLEDRALLEVQAQPHREDQQHEAEQERQPPAPAQQLLLGQHAEQERPQRRRGQRARVRAERHQRGDHAAALHGRVLGQHHGRAGDLGAGPEALDEAERDEQDRRRDADHRVGRERPDEGGRGPHQRDREEQDLLAADPVAHPAEVDRAREAGDVADAVGRHRGDQADRRADVGEEDLVEDDGRGQRVQLEVHELHGRTEPAGHGGLGQVSGGSRRHVRWRSVGVFRHRSVLSRCACNWVCHCCSAVDASPVTAGAGETGSRAGAVGQISTRPARRAGRWAATDEVRSGCSARSAAPTTLSRAATRVDGSDVSCQQRASASVAGSVVPKTCCPAPSGRVALTQAATASSRVGVPALARPQRPQRVEPPLGDLQRSVRPDLPQEVVHGRVAEPFDQVVDVRRGVRPRGRQGRGDLGAEAAHQPLAPPGRQHLGDRPAARGRPEVGHGRVGAVEQAQLHQLVRRDVRDDQCPVELPRRARRDEGVLEHPLPVRLPQDRHLVAQAERGGDGVPVLGGGRRDDAVDDGVREADRGAQPVEDQPPVRPRRGLDEAPHDAREGGAVRGGVVAGHDVDRCRAGPEAGSERRGQPADDRDEVSGARVRRRGEIRGDTGGRRVQAARVGSPGVALLRDGQGHRRHLGRGDQRVDPGGVRAHTHGVDQSTDHPGAAGAGGEVGHRVQAVLGAHRRHGIRRAGCDGDDAPRLAGTGRGGLGVDRLVGPVEGTETEVDDAGPQFARVDERAMGRGEPGEGGVVQLRGDRRSHGRVTSRESSRRDAAPQAGSGARTGSARPPSRRTRRPAPAPRRCPACRPQSGPRCGRPPWSPRRGPCTPGCRSSGR